MKRVFAEINLDAIKHNFNIIKSHTTSLIMCAVKADAYGHGADYVAHVLDVCGADYFAVADVYEGIELRKSGIKKPCLILGYSDEPETVIQNDLIPAIFDTETARRLSQAAEKEKKTAKIHLAFDTGMSRIGFDINNMEDSDTIVSQIKEISSLPYIEIEGAFSHFSVADENPDFTKKQFDKFIRFTELIENEGISIKIKHICNSAGSMLYPEYHLDMIRPGIVLYGLLPSPQFDKFGFIPVLELKAAVTRISELDKGRTVSYGNTFTAKSKMRLATVGIGYGDGYMRSLSDKAFAVCRGQKIKNTGRICMDQCMFDVTCVNNICVGDHVILFGREFTADQLAEIAGTIGYELICAVSRRVPRIYYEGDKVIGEVNYLLEKIVR